MRVSALGGIDIVVHNATASGQHGEGPQGWINNFNVDVLGMVAMSEGALPCPGGTSPTRAGFQIVTVPSR